MGAYILHIGANIMPIDMSRQAVYEGYRKHAALTQLHRWYQHYENQGTKLENQLDILDEHVRVKSGLGEVQGHEAYTERIKQLPDTWQNAHFLRTATVTFQEDNINLNLEIDYHNLGMKDNGDLRTAQLAYATKLKTTDAVLPRFTEIEITQLAEATPDKAFKSAYPENRLLSLIHYWLTLIEDPARDAVPVCEILADNFSLNFSDDSQIQTFDEFEVWLHGPASQVKASTHEISNFSYSVLSEHQYRLQVDFDWQGILPNDAQMIAQTRHTWTVIDDPQERFARIQQMDVEALLPFQMKA